MSSAPTLPPTGPALAATIGELEQVTARLTSLLTPTVLADLPDVVVGDLAVRLAAVAE